jgi:hypothetical protein
MGSEPLFLILSGLVGTLITAYESFWLKISRPAKMIKLNSDPRE